MTRFQFIQTFLTAVAALFAAPFAMFQKKEQRTEGLLHFVRNSEKPVMICDDPMYQDPQLIAMVGSEQLNSGGWYDAYIESWKKEQQLRREELFLDYKLDHLDRKMDLPDPRHKGSNTGAVS